MSDNKKQCWRTKDNDGDIWSEDAIVFDEEKPLAEVFTSENMYKLFDSYPEAEYAVEITIAEYSVNVAFSLHGNLDDDDNDPDEFTFYKMGKVLVV